jgi:hypothetical protein
MSGAAADPWRPLMPVPPDAPREVPRHRLGEPAATWEYRDPSCDLLFAVCRFDHLRAGEPAKDVVPLCYCEGPGGKLSWRWKGPGEPRPLYGLDRLAARPDAPVLICEGEKSADAAGLLFPDHVAITSVGGCRAARKAYWSPLAGRDVVVWPDHDAEGAAYARDVAQLALDAGATGARIVSVPVTFPAKWDLADPLPADVTAPDLRALLDNAASFSPRPDAPSKGSATAAPATDAPALADGEVEAEIQRLVTLSPIAYERERSAAAKRLAMRSSILDRLVAAERKEPASGQGRQLELREPEPWPEAVLGPALLNGVERAIRRHVVLDDAAAVALTLWCVAAHAHSNFDIFPRLFVTSPTKGAGKTTLLDVIERLSPRPLAVSSATAAALFRVIPTMRPVLLLDEADAWARDNEDVRMVINAGHKRGAAVLRCVGDENEPRAFDVFAPAALAAIGRLPDTIEDRAVVVQLRRKLPGEFVDPLRAGQSDLHQLARQVARWVNDHAEALADAQPAIPAGMANRAADNWAPLLAVADQAGGDWPERARRAASTLVGGEDQSRGVMLLADIRNVFRDADRMSSEELVERLVELEDRPWPDYRNGRPITKAQLSRALRAFGILSKTIRLDDGRTPKGFSRESFDDAWARYLPPAEIATTPQPDTDKALRHISERHDGGGGGACGVSGDDENPNHANGCGAVADCAGACSPDADGQAEFEERAAVREFDGGFSRPVAERLAAKDVGQTARLNPAKGRPTRPRSDNPRPA